MAQRPVEGRRHADPGARGRLRARQAAVHHPHGRADPAVAGRGHRDLAAGRVLARRAGRGGDDARRGRARRGPAAPDRLRRPARARLRPGPDRRPAGGRGRGSSPCPPRRSGIALGALRRRPPGRATCSPRSTSSARAARSLRPLLLALLAVVAVVVAAATWPAWRAARRPPVEILRGGDLARRPAAAAAGGRPLGVGGGLFALGVRVRQPRRAGAGSPPSRRSPCAPGVVTLMLALASLLERLREDPGTVGKRYQLAVTLDRRALPEARATAGGRRGRASATASTRPTRSGSASRCGWSPTPATTRDFEDPPLAEGRRIRGPDEVEVGLGMADALGLRPGSVLAAQIPDGGEVRFRVAGIVRALENDGRIAWVRPTAARVAARSERRRSSCAWSAGADPAAGAPASWSRSARRPRRVGAAQTDNAAFLAVLAAVLRGVGLAVGLVCLYALVQALTVTARERRGAVALLRALGADGADGRPRARGRRGRGGGPRRDRRRRARGRRSSARSSPASPRASPRCRSRPPPARSRSCVGGLLALVGDRHRARRPARAARADRRGTEGGVSARRPRRARRRRRAAPRSPLGPRARRVRRRRRPAAPRRPRGGSTLDRDARRPRRRRVPRAGPGEPLRDRGRGRQRPAATLAHLRRSSPTPTSATRSRPRGCRSSTASARRSRSTFRPQEAFSTQVLDAAVRALNREQPAGRVRHRRHHRQRAAQRARRWRSRRSTAARSTPTAAHQGYDGVQARRLRRPVLLPPRPRRPRATRARSRAHSDRSRPTGLTAPWYPLVGNHDVLAQGEVPPTPEIDAFATGDRLVPALDPRRRAAA